MRQRLEEKRVGIVAKNLLLQLEVWEQLDFVEALKRDYLVSLGWVF
jgi:hypothetical protein